MDEKISLLISVGIPAIISIVGFGVTLFTIKKGFQNELAKQRANMQLTKMSEMPYEILAFMQDVLDSGRKKTSSLSRQELQEKLNWIFSTIYAYGSSRAIRILAAMQSENYQNVAMPEKFDKFRVMAFYVLLTVQIRADITGEIVSPEEWFKMKLTDFQTSREMLKAANNQLVEELNLDSRFIMN